MAIDRSPTLQVATGTPPPDWDRALQALGGCAFHSSVWSQYSAESNDTIPLYFRLVEASDEVVAVACAQASRRRMLRIAGTQVLGLGSLPVSKNTASGDRLLLEVVDYAAQEGFASLRINSFGTPFACSVLEDGNFQLRRRWEFLVKLPGSQDELWQTIHSKKRNLIRKGTKSGLLVYCGASFRDLSRFKELAIATWARKRRQGIALPVPRDDAHWQLMHDRLLQTRLARLYIAKAGTKAVAGAVFVLFNGGAYYMLSAATEEGLKKAGPDLVLWTAMSDCIGEGCRVFNLGGLSETELGGAALEDSGLYHFKVRFGADVFPCWKAERILRPNIWRVWESIRRLRSGFR